MHLTHLSHLAYRLAAPVLIGTLGFSQLTYPPAPPASISGNLETYASVSINGFLFQDDVDWGSFLLTSPPPFPFQGNIGPLQANVLAGLGGQSGFARSHATLNESVNGWPTHAALLGDIDAQFLSVASHPAGGGGPCLTFTDSTASIHVEPETDCMYVSISERTRVNLLSAFYSNSLGDFALAYTVRTRLLNGAGALVASLTVDESTANEKTRLLSLPAGTYKLESEWDVSAFSLAQATCGVPSDVASANLKLNTASMLILAPPAPNPRP